MDENKIKEKVWQTMQAMNRAWTVKGDIDELKNYFHKDMVAITATDSERLDGRDACIAGWKAFVESTKIHYWKAADIPSQDGSNLCWLGMDRQMCFTCHS